MFSAGFATVFPKWRREIPFLPTFANAGSVKHQAANAAFRKNTGNFAGVGNQNAQSKTASALSDAYKKADRFRPAFAFHSSSCSLKKVLSISSIKSHSSSVSIGCKSPSSPLSEGI